MPVIFISGCGRDETVARALDASRVVTYDALLRRVWSGRPNADPKPAAVFVKDLRRKLGEDATDPTWIFNEGGIGYRLAEP